MIFHTNPYFLRKIAAAFWKEPPRWPSLTLGVDYAFKVNSERSYCRPEGSSLNIPTLQISVQTRYRNCVPSCAICLKRNASNFHFLLGSEFTFGETSTRSLYQYNRNENSGELVINDYVSAINLYSILRPSNFAPKT